MKTHDPGAECRGVRDLTPLHQQQLTVDPLRSTLDISAVRSDNVESSNTLSVQTGVLGVGLADEEGHLLLDEMANGPGIVVEVSRSESLYIGEITNEVSTLLGGPEQRPLRLTW